MSEPAVAAPMSEMPSALEIALGADAFSEYKTRIDNLESDSNVAWVLVTGFLVFFMQAGFAMLEAGAVAPKNAKHILFKNMLDGAIGVCTWLLIGFPLAFGGYDSSNAFLGVGQYFLSDDDETDYHFWFFQSTFTITAATITSGALAERCRTMAYVIYSTLLSAFIYPIVVHWIWSEQGWLSAFNSAPALGHGVIDFAGGGVVHSVGGVSALVGAWLLGYRNQFSTDPTRYRPRFERLVDENRWITNAAPPNSVSLQAMGVFILWFGWFGFNCGSTLAIVGYGRVAALVAVNSVVAGAAASLAAVIVGRFTNADKRFSMSDSLNGALAGLVAITSGCSTVEPWASAVIGIVAALCYKGTSELMLKLRIDDPLDAVAVHLAPGMWALISVGLFAARRHMDAAYSPEHGVGLFTHGEGTVLGVNLFGALMIVLWTGGLAFASFFTMKKLDFLRITPEQEEAGLGVDIGAGGATFDTSFAATDMHGPGGDELTDRTDSSHHITQSKSELSEMSGAQMALSDEQFAVLDLLASEDNATMLRRMLESSKKKDEEKRRARKRERGEEGGGKRNRHHRD